MKRNVYRRMNGIKLNEQYKLEAKKHYERCQYKVIIYGIVLMLQIINFFIKLQPQ